MKNDIFDFHRFGKYFLSDIRTCRANYGLSLLTISILFPAAVYLLTTGLNLVTRSVWDGPDMGLRFFTFAAAMFCLIVTMPVKCYGRITEKQYGSFWLTLPASRFEKFISMFLLTCIIVPISGAALFLGTDALICAIDHTCGNNLIAGGMELIHKMGDLKSLTMNFVDENVTIEDAAMVQDILKQVSSPWLYIDEIFAMTLPFLLGAVFFKTGKTVKTFIVLFAFSTFVSIIATPLMTDMIMGTANRANDDPMAVLQLAQNGFFKNLVLIDIISDTVTNLALMAGIWFRIKTLKH